MHLLIDCQELSQHRAACGLGAYISARRIISPNLSSLKIFAMFLSDQSCEQMQSKAVILYAMKVAWHNLMQIKL